VVVAVVADDVA